jgi:hypothetical protein
VSSMIFDAPICIYFVTCVIFFIGASDDCSSLNIKLLVSDITSVIYALKATVLGDRKVILIGHSVGAVIATFVVRYLAVLWYTGNPSSIRSYLLHCTLLTNDVELFSVCIGSRIGSF